MIPVYQDMDFVGLQAQRLVLHSSLNASPPSPAVAGMPWWETDRLVLNIYDGSNFLPIVTGPAVSDDGYIPVWNGSNGNKLSGGYAVETTLVGSPNAIPTAEAVVDYIGDNLWTRNAGIISPATVTDELSFDKIYVDHLSEKTLENGVIIDHSLTIAGTFKAAGYFYAGTTDPTNTTRLNYDGNLYATTLYSGGTQVSVVGHTHSYEPALGNPASDGYLLSSTTGGVRSWVAPPAAGVVPVDDILDWSTDKYTPYAQVNKAAGRFYLYAGTPPSNTTQLAYDGHFYANNMTASGIVQTNAGGAYTKLDGILNIGEVSTWNPTLRVGLHANYLAYFNHTNTSHLFYLDRVSYAPSTNLTYDAIHVNDNPITSGTIGGSIFKATVGTTVRMNFEPRVADSGSAVAYLLDTHNELFTSGSKLLSLRNQGSEKLFLDYSGVLQVESSVYAGFLSSQDYSLLDYNALSIYVTNTERLHFDPSVGNSAGAKAYFFDTANDLTTVGAKLLSISNAGSEKFYIDKDGAAYVNQINERTAGNGIAMGHDTYRTKVTITPVLDWPHDSVDDMTWIVIPINGVISNERLLHVTISRAYYDYSLYGYGAIKAEIKGGDYDLPGYYSAYLIRSGASPSKGLVGCWSDVASSKLYLYVQKDVSYTFWVETDSCAVGTIEEASPPAGNANYPDIFIEGYNIIGHMRITGSPLKIGSLWVEYMAIDAFVSGNTNGYISHTTDYYNNSGIEVYSISHNIHRRLYYANELEAKEVAYLGSGEIAFSSLVNYGVTIEFRAGSVSESTPPLVATMGYDGVFRVDHVGELTSNHGIVFDGSDKLFHGPEFLPGVPAQINFCSATTSYMVKIGTSAGNVGLYLLSAAETSAFLYFGDSNNSEIGTIHYNHATDSMLFRAGYTYVMSLSSTGMKVDHIGEYNTSHGVHLDSNFLELDEMVAPSAPSANLGRLYMDTSNEHLYFKTSTTTFDLCDPSAGGYVNVYGTPMDNQLAIWTDANTIEGNANLTFTTSPSTLYVINTDSGGVQIIAETTYEGQVAALYLRSGPTTGVSMVCLGNTTYPQYGMISYGIYSNTMLFYANNAVQMSLDSGGLNVDHIGEYTGSHGVTIDNIVTILDQDTTISQQGNLFYFYGANGLNFRTYDGNAIEDRFIIDYLGNIRIGPGTTAPRSILDVYTNSTSTGYISLGVTTNVTNKFGYLIQTQYHSTSEYEGYMLVGGYAGEVANNVFIGGGSDARNAATDIQFYTAPDLQTHTGVLRLGIERDGVVSIPWQLKVDHVEEYSSGHRVIVESGVSITPTTTPVGSLKTFNIGSGNVRFDGAYPETVLEAALSGTGAGNVDNGQHRYCVTYITEEGESGDPSYEIGGTWWASVTVTDKDTDGKVQLSNIPTAPAWMKVTGRRIWRSKAGTAQYYCQPLDVINNNTETTYLDNIADSALTGVYIYRKDNTTVGRFYIGQSLVWSMGRSTSSFGFGAAANITSGYDNTFIGYLSGYAVTTGTSNVSIGSNAMYNVTTGYNNIMIGYAAGVGPNLGMNCSVAIGTNALRNDTGTGPGSYNTAIGEESLNGQSGVYNTAIGYWAGKSLIDGVGNYNVYVGARAGNSTASTTASYNTFIGFQAGYNGSTPFTTASSNMLIGYLMQLSSATVNYEFKLGYNNYALIEGSFDPAGRWWGSQYKLKVDHIGEFSETHGITFDNYIYAGGARFNSAVTILANATNLQIRGTDHAYIAFYPDNDDRGAWVGFGSQGSTVFSLYGEIGDTRLGALNNIQFEVQGGQVGAINSTGALLINHIGEYSNLHGVVFDHKVLIGSYTGTPTITSPLQVFSLVDVANNDYTSFTGINFHHAYAGTNNPVAAVGAKNYNLVLQAISNIGDTGNSMDMIRLMGATFVSASLPGTFVSVTGTADSSGTASYTGLKVNIIEIGVGSGSNRLLDLQVGGSSKFYVSNTGKAYLDHIGELTGSHRIQVDSPVTFNSSGVIFGSVGSPVHSLLAGTSSLFFYDPGSQGFQVYSQDIDHLEILHNGNVVASWLKEGNDYWTQYRRSVRPYDNNVIDWGTPSLAFANHYTTNLKVSHIGELVTDHTIVFDNIISASNHIKMALTSVMTWDNSSGYIGYGGVGSAQINVVCAGAVITSFGVSNGNYTQFHSRIQPYDNNVVDIGLPGGVFKNFYLGGYVQFAEGDAPAAPGSNLGRLYMDNADEKLYWKTSTTTYDLTSGGVTPTSDILEWSTNKYTPYAEASRGAGKLYAYVSNLPSNSTALAYDGYFYTTRDYVSQRTTWMSGAAYTYIEPTRLITYDGTDTIIDFNPGIGDGGSSVAYFFDTTNALATTGAKLVSFRNNQVEKLYVTYNGDLVAPVLVAGTTSNGTIITNVNIEAYISSTKRMYLCPAVSDSGAGIAYTFDTSNVLTSGRKLASFQNQGTELWCIDFDGAIRVPAGSARHLLINSGNASGDSGTDAGNLILKAGNAIGSDSGSQAGYLYLVPGNPYTSADTGLIRLGHETLFTGGGISLPAVGTTDNIAVTISAKGTGVFTIESPSNYVSIKGTDVMFGSNSVLGLTDSSRMLLFYGGNGTIAGAARSGATGYDLTVMGGTPSSGDNNGGNLYLFGGNASGSGVIGDVYTRDLFPYTDNTYYLGKNSISTPKAWKGVVLKDTTNGNYYRITVVNGTITATQIT